MFQEICWISIATFLTFLPNGSVKLQVKSLWDYIFELSLFRTINGRVSLRIRANLLSMKRNVVQVTQRVYPVYASGLNYRKHNGIWLPSLRMDACDSTIVIVFLPREKRNEGKIDAVHEWDSCGVVIRASMTTVSLVGSANNRHRYAFLRSSWWSSRRVVPVFEKCKRVRHKRRIYFGKFLPLIFSTYNS